MRKNNFICLGLITLVLVGCSHPSNKSGDPTSEEESKTGIKSHLESIKNGGSYTLEISTDIHTTIGQTELSGWNSIAKVDKDSYEYGLSDASGNVITNIDLGNVDGGVMRYHYDEEGAFVKERIVDPNTTYQKTRRASVFGISDSFTYPLKLTEEDTSFELAPDKTNDYSLMNSFFNASIINLKDIQSQITSSVISYEENEGLNLRVDLNQNFINFLVKDIGIYQNEAFSTFLKDDGVPTPVDSNIKKIIDEGSGTSLAEFNITSADVTDKAYLNFDSVETPYIYVDYAVNTVENSTQKFDLLIVPLIGIEGIKNSIYALPLEDKKLAFDATDKNNFTNYDLFSHKDDLVLTDENQLENLRTGYFYGTEYSSTIDYFLLDRFDFTFETASSKQNFDGIEYTHYYSIDSELLSDVSIYLIGGVAATQNITASQVNLLYSENKVGYIIPASVEGLEDSFATFFSRFNDQTLRQPDLEKIISDLKK